MQTEFSDGPAIRNVHTWTRCKGLFACAHSRQSLHTRPREWQQRQRYTAGFPGDTSFWGHRGQNSGGSDPRPSRIMNCWRNESSSFFQSCIAESCAYTFSKNYTSIESQLTPVPLLLFPWSGSDVGGSSSRSIKLSTYSCCHPFEIAIPFHSLSSWSTVFFGAVEEVLTEDIREPVATLKPLAKYLSFLLWRVCWGFPENAELDALGAKDGELRPRKDAAGVYEVPFSFARLPLPACPLTIVRGVRTRRTNFGRPRTHTISASALALGLCTMLHYSLVPTLSVNGAEESLFIKGKVASWL